MEKHEAVRTHEHCVWENGQITQETPTMGPSKVHLMTWKTAKMKAFHEEFDMEDLKLVDTPGRVWQAIETMNIFH